MEEVFQWAKNITYYIIFISLLSHLMPAGKYEPYIKLFFGTVLILLVVQPLTGKFPWENQLAYVYEQIRFGQEHGEFQEKLWGMENKRMEQILTQYEEAVTLDIRAMVEEEGFACILAEAEIEGREEEENFGQVVRLSLVIGEHESEKRGEAVIGSEREAEAAGRKEKEMGTILESEKERNGERAVSIDKVQVIVGSERGTDGGGRQSMAVEELQRKVAKYYGLEEKAVQIIWQDD